MHNMLVADFCIHAFALFVFRTAGRLLAFEMLRLFFVGHAGTERLHGQLCSAKGLTFLDILFLKRAATGGKKNIRDSI